MEEKDPSTKCFIIIRHGKKLYANGEFNLFKLDPPMISTSGEIEDHVLKCLGSFILACYKMKTNANLDAVKIVSSPFLRNRATTESISKIFKIDKFSIDNRISEYLGNQKKSINEENIDTLITEKTKDLLKDDFKFLGNEDKQTFKERISNFLENAFDETPTIYVSHGYFITVAFQLLIKKYSNNIVFAKFPNNNYYNVLEGFSAVRKDGKISIVSF